MSYSQERLLFPYELPMYQGKLGEVALLGAWLDGERDGSIHIIPGPDNRHISVRQTGNLEDPPVFIMGGTPGGRGAYEIASYTARHLGVCILQYDRPGYGFSDPNPGRSPADSVDDVRAVTHYFGIKQRLGIVGRSGGGLHALACATLMPEVSRAAILSSFGPREHMSDLEWFEGMSPSNRAAYEAARADPDLLTRSITQNARDIRILPRTFFAKLQNEFALDDHKVFREHLTLERQVLRSYFDSLRLGPEGWLEDVRGQEACGFDPRGSMCAESVLVWHGGDDVFVPYGHGLWLAQNIPNARHIYAANASHFRAMDPNVVIRAVQWTLTGEYQLDSHEYLLVN